MIVRIELENLPVDKRSDTDSECATSSGAFKSVILSEYFFCLGREKVGVVLTRG